MLQATQDDTWVNADFFGKVGNSNFATNTLESIGMLVWSQPIARSQVCFMLTRVGGMCCIGIIQEDGLLVFFAVGM